MQFLKSVHQDELNAITSAILKSNIFLYRSFWTTLCSLHILESQTQFPTIESVKFIQIIVFNPRYFCGWNCSYNNLIFTKYVYHARMYSIYVRYIIIGETIDL